DRVRCRCEDQPDPVGRPAGGERDLDNRQHGDAPGDPVVCARNDGQRGAGGSGRGGGGGPDRDRRGGRRAADRPPRVQAGQRRGRRPERPDGGGDPAAPPHDRIGVLATAGAGLLRGVARRPGEHRPRRPAAGPGGRRWGGVGARQHGLRRGQPPPPARRTGDRRRPDRLAGHGQRALAGRRQLRGLGGNGRGANPGGAAGAYRAGRRVRGPGARRLALRLAPPLDPDPGAAAGADERAGHRAVWGADAGLRAGGVGQRAGVGPALRRHRRRGAARVAAVRGVRASPAAPGHLRRRLPVDRRPAVGPPGGAAAAAAVGGVCLLRRRRRAVEPAAEYPLAGDDPVRAARAGAGGDQGGRLGRDAPWGAGRRVRGPERRLAPDAAGGCGLLPGRHGGDGLQPGAAGDGRARESHTRPRCRGGTSPASRPPGAADEPFRGRHGRIRDAV
ncbi:MAG: hypothetical protein AVDCRST_MAG73-2985, partial [uncultured Thermomicrobiales bacterium]